MLGMPFQCTKILKKFRVAYLQTFLVRPPPPTFWDRLTPLMKKVVNCREFRKEILIILISRFTSFSFFFSVNKKLELLWGVLLFDAITAWIVIPKIVC